MSSGSGNVSSILNLGLLNANSIPLTISEANSQGYFTIYAGNAPSTTNFGVFYKNGVAYQVTAGKTCKVVGIIYTANSPSSTFQFVSATASFVQGAGSLTGPVYQFGASGIYGMISSPNTSQYQTDGITYDFAASTFPGFQAGGTANYSIMLICKEI